MVNEEYKEEVRKKYGKCECGEDIEYVILKESYLKMYHINFIGNLSERYNVKKEEPTEVIESMCLKCYHKKGYTEMENIHNLLKMERVIESFDIVMLIESNKYLEVFNNVWENITDIYNRKLHIPKESSPFINRDLEMLIHRTKEKIMPIRNDIEKIIDVIKEKKEDLMRKF
ncbi:MAG: hypothetical protein ACFFG0_08135 [Candidatus Thorarchaeota archaeon]